MNQMNQKSQMMAQMAKGQGKGQTEQEGGQMNQMNQMMNQMASFAKGKAPGPMMPGDMEQSQSLPTMSKSSAPPSNDSVSKSMAPATMAKAGGMETDSMATFKKAASPALQGPPAKAWTDS